MTDGRPTSTSDKSDPLADFLKGALIAAAVVGGVYVAARGVQKLLEPPRRRQQLLPPRRRARTVEVEIDIYNREPLPERKREAVMQRDGYTCVYCGARASHVDHRRSRRNGGTNHLNNLSASCAACNLRKGSMNARAFMRMNNRSYR